MLMSPSSQFPEGYENKTARLAEELVSCSIEGDYAKTYNAMRRIQKYEYRLDKDQLVTFYSDLHKAVEKSCDKHGIDENGKKEMKVIVDALFSDDLKSAVTHEENQ